MGKKKTKPQSKIGKPTSEGQSPDVGFVARFLFGFDLIQKRDTSEVRYQKTAAIMHKEDSPEMLFVLLPTICVGAVNRALAYFLGFGSRT